MNAQYKGLRHKQDFCRNLAFRLGLEKDSLRGYLEKDKFPEKHKDRIEKALLIQVEFDEKEKELFREV